MNIKTFQLVFFQKKKIYFKVQTNYNYFLEICSRKIKFLSSKKKIFPIFKTIFQKKIYKKFYISNPQLKITNLKNIKKLNIFNFYTCINKKTNCNLIQENFTVSSLLSRFIELENKFKNEIKEKEEEINKLKICVKKSKKKIDYINKESVSIEFMKSFENSKDIIITQYREKIEEMQKEFEKLSKVNFNTTKSIILN